ncbi:MAG: hypothetical protein K2M82_05260, partial [Lachnospiraceae bacterium]|nr:hypothetical protein [Lachnospiraceae bacterium]
ICMLLSCILFISAMCGCGYNDTSDTPSLSNSWQEFELSLDNSKIKLPCKFSDIKALGWTINEDFSDEEKAGSLSANSITDNALCTVNKDYESYLFLTMANTSDSNMPYDECTVIGLQITVTDNPKKSPTLTLAGGITWGSDVNDVVAAYGAPLHEPTSVGINSTLCSYHTSNNDTMNLTIDNDKGLSYVYLKLSDNVLVTENTDV